MVDWAVDWVTALGLVMVFQNHPVNLLPAVAQAEDLVTQGCYHLVDSVMKIEVVQPESNPVFVPAAALVLTWAGTPGLLVLPDGFAKHKRHPMVRSPFPINYGVVYPAGRRLELHPQKHHHPAEKQSSRQM